MREKIYLVTCKGHKQTLWFSTLANAKAYCEEYGKDNYSIHEYTYSREVEKAEPKPLYKPLW